MDRKRAAVDAALTLYGFDGSTPVADVMANDDAWEVLRRLDRALDA